MSRADPTLPLKFEMARLQEKALKSRCVYKGKAVSFFKDAVSLPDGRKTSREYMKHPGAVAVVAYLNPKTILMQRQYRYPVGKTILEIPAGKLNPAGQLAGPCNSKGSPCTNKGNPAGSPVSKQGGPKESPLACARRELLEETGYWPRKIRKVFSFWPTPAFATEVIHIFIAWDLAAKEIPHKDPDEFMESFKVSFQTALQWIKQGRVRDAKTVIALLTTEVFHLNPFPSPTARGKPLTQPSPNGRGQSRRAVLCEDTGKKGEGEG